MYYPLLAASLNCTPNGTQLCESQNQKMKLKTDCGLNKTKSMVLD